MLKRVNEILIGKDIARTGALADAATMKTIQENILEGEVVVLDKNLKVAAIAVTYALSDVLYIAEGTGIVKNYYDEPGTALVAREIILSSAIDGAKVTQYLGGDYSAKVEKIATIGAITSVVAGTEYVLRIVYKDIVEHPGQFEQTYRYTAVTGDASQDVFDGLRARIIKHTGRLSVKGGSRVVGSGSTTLILTGKPIPECTTALTDIDEFTLVDFEVFFNYVDSDYNWQTVVTAGLTYTLGETGNGTWELIRDVEKHAQSYRGVDNRTWFPIQTPAFRTVKDAEYGQIVIEHDTVYRSSDNQYNKETSKSTVIAIDYQSATNDYQGDNIQVRLNSWMASIPNPFAAIAVFPTT